jgi:BirA family biotin operon repressor/biotin-[acetyl-CoA-carboxylase] ligase
MSGSELLFQTADEVKAFSSALRQSADGWSITYQARTESTNDLASRAAREGAEHGLTFVVDEQTAGRGQRGRSWHSPPGLSLLFSSIVRGPGLTPERTGWVALCAGWACVEALREEAGIEVRLKWPNDLVVLDGSAAQLPWRKLGGILVESRVTGQLQVDHGVIGIGVNVNQLDGEFPEDARTPPVSLRLLAKRSLGRNALLAALLRRLATQLSWVRGDGDFAATTGKVARAFERWWRGWTLRVNTPSGVHSGRFVALTPDGCLKLAGLDGHDRTFSDAEWLDGKA